MAVDSAGDVAGHEGGVVAHAVDEVRVAAVLEALSEDVEAGDGGDAAPLDDLAVAVEDRDPQPRVGAAVAGGPDDRRDAVAPGVEPRDRLGGRSRAGVSAGRTSRVQAGGRRCGRRCGRGAGARRSSAAAVVAVQVVGERQVAAVDAGEPTGDPDAEPLQRGQVDVAVVARGRRAAARPRRAPRSGRPTSSMVRANVPIWSSHHQMSMPR